MRMALGALVALTLSLTPALGFAQSAEAELEAWEEQTGDDTDSDRGRYSEPLVRQGPWSPRLETAGQVTFFVGLGVGALFGGGGALVVTQVEPRGTHDISVGIGALMLVVGGLGGAAMVTGGVLWGVGAHEPGSSVASVRLTPDGVAFAF